MRLLKVSGVLCCLAAAGCWSSNAVGNATNAPAPVPAPRSYTPRKVCDMADKRINESSGLGASRRYPGLLWTHNDSGDDARLFLVSREGKTKAVVNLENASAADWEDMAVAGEGNGSWVYAADIGDNLRWRPFLTIYRFREPQLDGTAKEQNVRIKCERMVVNYPEDAYDAETLIATRDGHLLIVTKSTDTSLIFKTPKPFANGAKLKLVKVGEYSFGKDRGDRSRMTTSGELSTDGRRLVISTYTQAHEWIVPLDTKGAPDWVKLWKSAPRTSSLPDLSQSEAICYSFDGQKLFVTSEGEPAPLYELTPAVKSLTNTP